MSLINAVVKTGATWSSTGGTDLTLTPSGRTISNGIELVVASDSSLLTRRSVEFKVSLPALPASTNAYAKMGRRGVVYRIPYVASDGKLYIETMRIDAAFHADDTRQNGLINDGVALLADPDFTGFWQNLLLS